MARTQSDLITHGRRLNDLGVALVESIERAGGNDEDARRVFKDGLIMRRLGLLVMGKLKLIRFPSDIHAANHIYPGWMVDEDVEPAKFNFADLEFVPFLEGDEDSIDDAVLRQRAVTLRGNMGLCDAKQILTWGTIIPSIYWNKLIVFPGTVLCDTKGRFNIPYLTKDESGCSLSFRELHHLWNNLCLLARIKQVGQAEAVR